MRSSSVEEVGGHGPGDPWEVFSALAILVVEGRTPGGERGYHAGPHCPLPHQLQHKHNCDQNDHMCVQAGALMRQLRVMWGVGVGVSLEVLVAPECQHGAALATTLDTPIAPSQNLRLIEQWNFTIYDRRLPEAAATGWSLVAAVRSFLHFSQLSAWLSVSRGRRPPNVLYRLTVTSPVFCSKFTEEAEEHVFPLAYMGQDTSIKVAVRSLPRSEKVPVVVCYEPHEDSCEEMPSDESLPSCSQNKTEMARGDEDLRRSVMKARLAENTRVSRSESPDTQLGESLLDPPHSLTRFPRRYQSPVRSGSPSLETPEHLICRHRHPVPPNSRPPDVMPLGPSAARHPFSWTQARYPVPPVSLHPTSLASVCPSSSGIPHQQQQSSHHMQHCPYRIDYSGASQHFQRPHPVYNRPQVCLSQPQSINQLHLQKPHSSHHNLQSLNFDQLQKQQGSLSPRGGKYQNYPEYQYNDQAESSRDYVGPSKRYKSTRLLSDGCSESDYSYSFKPRGDCSEMSRNVQGTSSSSVQGGSMQRREEGENSSEWECKRNGHNGSSSACLPQLPVEAESHSGEPTQKSSGKVGAGLKRGSSSGEKRCKTEKLLPKVIDDQLRPCCSHTGKHLCSSMEDLSEVCDKEPESSCHLHSKDIKQEMKHRGDVSPSHLFRNKFNFDLTPKETMEILSVLRQSSNSPRSHSKVRSPKGHSEMKNLHLGLDPDMKSEKQLWANKEMERKVLEDKGKRLEGHFGLDSVKVAREWETGEAPSTSCKSSQLGPSYLSSLGCSEHRNSDRCQNENRGRGDARELTSSPENQFLEAIALSSEKQCDIPSCKTLVDSCEPLWTRVCSDNACDNDSDLMKKGIIYGLEEGYRESENQQCVEAKKITLKTNFYTACSEPAKALHCQPQKQVSHTLSKSPFIAILSSIQNEYNQDITGEQLHMTGHSNATSSTKESAKRVLNFQDDEETHVHQKAKEDIPSKISIAKSHLDQNDWKTGRETGKESVVRSRETREGFVKSASLLKHLMTRGHPSPPQENSQDDRPFILDGSELADAKQSPVQLETGQKIKQIEDDKQVGNDTEMQLDDLISEDDEVEKYCNMKGVTIPSASEKAQFRRSLDSATNMVFHSKTGLPLTSSPAPLRKGKRFDYDSSLVSVAAIKRSTSFHCSALYACDTEEEEAYTIEMHAVCHEHKAARKLHQLSMSAPATVTCSNLLGSFEECVLNGRLEPVSTVQGFTAEIAASGAFCPKRITKPVTVFFYTLCDNDQISSPYMGHINLGKKGYHVPSKGTVQVTLFNPHGTVVKMFVVMYDLSDMPPNSRTFVRQRTLNMPVGASDADDNAHQWLRYLIHLRFVSSKSGKIYLHTDIRMLILRKSDADAATLHKTSVPYELRSFTHGPTNPKFSPRK